MATPLRFSNRQEEKIFYRVWESPVGLLHIYANADSLIGLAYPANNEGVVHRLGLKNLIEEPSAIIDAVIEQLKEYFEGIRTSFDVPHTLEGTSFQKKAWSFLKEIPVGTAISYKEQAERMEANAAFRAVGSANGKNPISIIVPCHRVLGSDGKISGYAGGPEVKAKLLALEGYRLKASRKD